MSEELKRFPEDFEELGRELSDNDFLYGANHESGGNVKILFQRFLTLFAIEQGVSTLIVRGTGTPLQNGDKLLAAYTLAKTKSPSINNVISIVVAPGVYLCDLVLDTQYINIKSLTGEPDVILKSISVAADYVTVVGVSIYKRPAVVTASSANITCAGHGFTANQKLYSEKHLSIGGGLYGIVYVKQVIDENTFTVSLTAGGSAATMGESRPANFIGIGRFAIGDNLPNIVIKNCVGDTARSFCVAEDSGPGSTNILSGTFIDVKSRAGNCFGTAEIVAGTFIRCAIYYQPEVASTGAAVYALGYANECSGYFEDVTVKGNGFQRCFGAYTVYGKATGFFIRCFVEGTSSRCFGGVLSSGKFFDIITDGQAFCPICDNSFQADALVSGEYYNCKAGNYSWGGCYGTGTSGQALFTGICVNCVGGYGSWGGASASNEAGMAGVIINCVMQGAPNILSGDIPTFKNPLKRVFEVNGNDTPEIYLTGHNLKPGHIVRFETTGTLPAPLAINTDYYVREADMGADYFSVSTTGMHGSDVSITDYGTGTHRLNAGRIINCVDATRKLVNL